METLEKAKKRYKENPTYENWLNYQMVKNYTKK